MTVPGRPTSRPNILVSNDDGIHAAGLAALAAGLETVGEVYVVAPDRERSAVGHALTLHRPLRVESLGARRFAVNGTPTDCVNLGILGILPVRPDVVVAGINSGSNLGDDVTYSGTVSAAMEEASSASRRWRCPWWTPGTGPTTDRPPARRWS
jgi:5'-nucleotidase